MYKDLSELRSQLDEKRSKRDRQIAERANLLSRQDAGPDAGIDERLSNTNRGIERLDNEIRDLEAEYGRVTASRERVAHHAKNPNSHEDGSPPAPAARRVDRSPVARARDEALRSMERIADDLGARAATSLEAFVQRDRDGLDARYIAAVSAEPYERAFARLLSRPQTAQFEMAADEAEALRRVADVTQQRAMAVGTPSAGGYGIPATIDPTIMLTSDGAINPLREVARVRSITTSEWRGISSAGVVASFGAEGSEVADGTPTLAQPTITPERASAFVPFSFEVGADYPALQQELGRLFADAKDTLEAEKFVTGTGHGDEEPQGILTGATGTVAAGTASFAVAHLYNTQNALPPRFQSRASWLTSLAVKNQAKRLVGTADPDEPALFNDAGDMLLSKPWREVSDMPTVTTTGSRIAVYGDIAAGFEIVDRVGMSVELVPHLFGASGRPTGQRGLFAWWRTSSGIVNQAAIRVLQTT